MGPVEFIVLAFPEEQLRVPAVEAVMGLRKTGVVRLIDGLVVTRTAAGRSWPPSSTSSLSYGAC